MPVVAVLHHLERPSLGSVEAPLREAGLDLDERDLRRGDPLPSLDEVDGIVTLGGEQSIREIDSHPYLVAEAQWLREAVDRGVPVLGVCLGSQLLAHALGGRVTRAARRTIGWRELTPRPEVADDPIVSALPTPVPALHWNEDVFDLPPGAVELFDRPGDGVEAFCAGGCAWGVQFHPDVDATTLDSWYEYADWLAEAGVEESAAREADAAHMTVQGEASRSLFSAFARVVLARAGVVSG